MVRRPITAIVVAVLLVAPVARAWNGAGHMTLSAIAYRQLDASTRAKVDDLLSHHPDVERWDSDRAKYESTLGTGEYRFLRASTWPDSIKRKKGYPNRSSCHYANFPLTSAASSAEPDPSVKHNILAGLAESESVLGDPSASLEDRSVALAFVIHLIGDLHQPLHLATAITSEHPSPKGDEGGNETEVRIHDRRTVKLHEFWDDLLGKSKDPTDADHEALRLLHDTPTKSVATTGTERDWALESRQLAQTVAYPAAAWSASGDAPLAVGDEYIERAKMTAEHQMIVGGARLAETLERAFR